MAEPQKMPSSQASTVSSCAATDCAHNEDRECHADSIDVKFQDGRAICGTYAPDKPKARP